MSKEEDSKFLKIQACVLKVNICCDGCQKKVKKVLHKIDGVYTTTIDAEERKVIVTGNVDPAILIKKLSKVGKHAELWPTKGGNQQNLANQLQKLQFEHAKGQQKENGKTKKGGGGGGGGGGAGGGGGGGKDHKWQQPQPQQQQAKGFKDLKFPNLKDLKLPFKKESKTVKFDLPPEEEIDDEGDYSDDYDEFDDEDLDDLDGFDDEDMYDDPKMMKPMNFQPIGNGTGKDKKGNGHGGGGGGGGGGGKGGEVQVPNKAVGGSNINGGGGKTGGGGGGKNGDGAHDSKNGGGNKNKGGNGTAGNHANHGNPSHGGNKGGGGGGGGSNNGAGGGGGLPMGQPNMMGPMGHTQTAMGHMGSFPAVQGRPVGDGAPPGYFQGGMVPPEMMMAGANPYQQQYLQALMQQQRMMMMNGQDRPAFPPMGYGYGRPVYVPPPPPPGEPCTIFSDENPNGCSVM
ncbi:heavy metal-associated isoprenylated plant protein 33-like isoform X2 [Musa acuminata AAA Group]|uniref:heavy metal-associated isoprenylated plant protein 33-like isoform X2 n=1 Tax=Musa acuminata AAA Group TaxID=214697 RepID=UPI0031D78E60